MSHEASVDREHKADRTVGRTAWDVLYTLAKSRIFVFAVALSVLLVLAAAALGLLRFGFRDGFFVEIGPAAAAEAAGATGIAFTHKITSTCRNNQSRAKGINVRAAPLEGEALLAAQRSEVASASSLVAWLDNGSPVLLLETRGNWHHVAAVVDGRTLSGYLSATCSGQPTLAALPEKR
jgi:hypothetical protein